MAVAMAVAVWAVRPVGRGSQYIRVGEAAAGGRDNSLRETWLGGKRG